MYLKKGKKSIGHLRSAAENMGEGSFPFRAVVKGGGTFLLLDCKAKAEAGCRFWVMDTFVEKHRALEASL